VQRHSLFAVAVDLVFSALLRVIGPGWLDWMGVGIGVIF